MKTKRQEYYEQLTQLSKEAFANHKIARHPYENYWIIQRTSKNDPKQFTWNMAAEIIVTHSKNLIVTGDIDLVAFAYSSEKDILSVLKWIGKSTDIYYVAQKATIGMSKSGKTWDADIALEELNAIYNEEKEELEDYHNEKRAKDLDVILEAKDYVSDGQYAMLEYLGSNLSDGDLEPYYTVGEVISPDVFYAHAAVTKLCQLLNL